MMGVTRSKYDDIRIIKICCENVWNVAVDDSCGVVTIFRIIESKRDGNEPDVT